MSDAVRAKRQLRAVLRSDRAERAAARAAATGPREGELLAALVTGLAEVRGADVLTCYVSLPGEPDTGPLLEALRDAGRRVLLPVVLPDLDLDWAVDDGSRRPGARRGILEPAGPRLGTGAVATAGVLVVPALAVDRSGHRLGQGGGSYDRALARVRPGVPVVALLHPGELVDEPLPHEPHDRDVDVVVTLDGVARLSPSGST